MSEDIVTQLTNMIAYFMVFAPVTYFIYKTIFWIISLIEYFLPGEEVEDSNEKDK